MLQEALTDVDQHYDKCKQADEQKRIAIEKSDRRSLEENVFVKKRERILQSIWDDLRLLIIGSEKTTGDTKQLLE